MELNPTELAVLRSIKTVDGLTDVKCLSHGIKEGLPYVVLSVNGVELTLNNLDVEDAAALLNPDLEASRHILLKQVRLVHLQGGESLDDEDEFEHNDDSYDDDDSFDEDSVGDYGGDY